MNTANTIGATVSNLYIWRAGALMLIFAFFGYAALYAWVHLDTQRRRRITYERDFNSKRKRHDENPWTNNP